MEIIKTSVCNQYVIFENKGQVTKFSFDAEWQSDNSYLGRNKYKYLQKARFSVLADISKTNWNLVIFTAEYVKGIQFDITKSK